VREVLLFASLAAACGPGTPGSDNVPKPLPTPPTTAVEQSTVEWYAIADSAFPLPAACSAHCSLDCDVEVGSIDCPGDVGSLSVWGGLSSMVGMELDQSGASVEGHEELAGGSRLRWGTGATGLFCGTVASPTSDTRGLYWTWQLCAPDSAARRATILAIVKGSTKAFPEDQTLDCANTGC
jgi:hypothetical protein